MTTILNGKLISNQILNELAENIKNLSLKPVLAVIQIGDRKESTIYIRKKREACQLIGIESRIYNFETTVSTDEICSLLFRLNNDDEVNGILVQLPIPDHLNNEEILNKISYEKDVDGFHAQNMGSLALNGRTPSFIPCTPLGCLELLKRYNITIKGKHAVIIGKSNIVGLPMSLLLLKHDATVTICHIETDDIAKHLKMADIVISACGQPKLIKKGWLKKEGVVVIDVGINSIPDSTRKRGYRLVGDVDFDEVKEIASAITPVPGGVGPMTVAMLLKNTVQGFKKQNDL
jgi:5,10-methylene-tetrahydrofolate dehydrogenase/methenyl tetrahydrofolate cyclohydrolase